MKYTVSVTGFNDIFPDVEKELTPWEFTSQIGKLIERLLNQDHINQTNYTIDAEKHIAIHRTARVEQTARIMGPAIISADTIVGPYTCIRGGVYVAPGAIIGFSSEVKSAFVGPKSMIGHLNFVGDSIIGANVTLEGGAMVLNCGRGSGEENISVKYKDEVINTGTTKFGSIIGDNAVIGANAVLREGTIIPAGMIVPRLSYIDQIHSR